MLKGLGLYEAFHDRSVDTLKYNVVSGNGTQIKTYSMEEMFRPYDLMRMIKRSELLHLLANSIQDHIAIRMDTTVKELHQSNHEVTATFDNGHVEAFDLVVGADGIHSQVRAMLFGEIKMDDTGWGGWAWWIDQLCHCKPM